MITLYLATRDEFFPNAAPSDVWFVAAMELLLEALLLSLIIGTVMV
jgi:hypothetical protein